MKFSDLQKYKHDTIGKFVMLKELIESIDDDNIQSPESKEILEAADEVFQKMKKASEELLKRL